jgi:hypothetical protein
MSNEQQQTPPPEQQMAHFIFGKVVAMAISVAAKLRIADKLAATPMNNEELARETKTHPQNLSRLMRALISLGIFSEGGQGQYQLTPLSQLLRTGVKGSMRGMADFMGAEWSWKAWGHLMDSVRTGRTAFTEVYGEPCFDYLAKHPEESAAFNEGMVGFSTGIAEAVVKAFDFSAIKSMMDVGGGHGGLLLTILKATPKLQGIIFDSAHVVTGAVDPIHQAGLKDRCITAAGDFFKEVPGNVDAYILKHIIHDWNDVDAARILKTVRTAAKPGTKLFLVEAVIPENDKPHLGKLLDLEMMVIASGRERTQTEYAQLLSQTGFRLEKVIPTQSPVELIEAVAV